MLLPAYRSIQDMFLSFLFSAERLGSPDYDGDLLCPHSEPLREAERGPEIYPAKTGVRDKVIPISLFTTKGASLKMVMLWQPIAFPMSHWTPAG